MAPDPNAATPGLRRLWQMTWWSTSGLVYVVGAAAVVWLLLIDGPPVVRSAIALGVVVTSIAAGWLMAVPLRQRPDAKACSDHDGTTRTMAGAIIAGWVGAGAVLLAAPQLGRFADFAWLAGAIMTAAVVITVAPRVRSAVVAAGVALTVAGTTVTALVGVAGLLLATGEAGREAVLTAIFMVLFVTFAIATQSWMWDVAGRLDRARRLAGELAVADERLRFAADLHDIQGHHLQVIALKSELATRLAESDPAAAASHMAEVHRLARTALEDTREVVQGYRRVSLTAELANAAKVLGAAGIDCPLPDEELGTQLSEHTRHLLGLVVREATTNVLRHSSAREARMRLAVEGPTAALEVRNDGAGTAEDGDGTGLRALAERIDDAGGSLSWGRDGAWFRVVARLPVAAEVQA